MLRERVKTPADDSGVWTAKKVAAVIVATPGFPRQAMRPIGWTIQCPQPQHSRAATPEEQATFKKAGGSRRGGGRAPSRRGIQVFATDELRIG
jgi:hypothetical protein